MAVNRYMHNPLKYFKLHPDVKAPMFATEGSACFDIHAFIPDGTEVVAYDTWGDYRKLVVNEKESIFLTKGTRALIPTGLIFDIDKGWSVRLHSRSGLALKAGLVLANAEGVIDSDYVEPVFVMMINVGDRHQTLSNGDRICQGEKIMSYHYGLEEVNEKPLKKADRDGGFGATGTK